MQIIVKLFQNGPFEAVHCTPPTLPGLINTTKWKRDQQEISLNPELWSENIKTASSLWQHFKTIENQNDFSRKLQQRISNSTFHTSNKIYYLESGSLLARKILVCIFIASNSAYIKGYNHQGYSRSLNTESSIYGFVFDLHIASGLIGVKSKQKATIAGLLPLYWINLPVWISWRVTRKRRHRPPDSVANIF